MWLKWLPWRFLVSRLARSRGFIDPVTLLSRLHRFAQPSEVKEPIELLRAGVMFHARGLINTRAIQHNLDWVWPYWVERQFNPADRSFIPRAFSATHINLTHRNWTALGLPDWDRYPIVDPRGLLTPLFDEWSLDLWVIPENGRPLLPSRCRQARQRLHFTPNLAVSTKLVEDHLYLEQIAEVLLADGRPNCQLRARARATGPAWLAVALRPVNPEGISFIHQVRASPEARHLVVNEQAVIEFDQIPERLCMSTYAESDVLQKLPHAGQQTEITCRVGLATAAALFQMQKDKTTEVTVQVPLDRKTRTSRSASPAKALSPRTWQEALAGSCLLEVNDTKIQFLYEAAVRTLILHSPHEVYPGPYTYRRFWFRDAAFILEALLALGLADRVEQCLRIFPARQQWNGYFRSQEGEWDSNGEALWILHRYAQISDRPLPEELLESAAKGAQWICRKRLDDESGTLHAGLMPAGFSAEHFGPNDYYYWDDFWSAAGLRAAAELFSHTRPECSAAWRREAERLLAAVDRSIERSSHRRDRPGVPSSPYRRMDSAAVGILAAGYPLRLWAARDPRLLDTADFLARHCLVNGGFFQDMIHSGVNAYLTLHLAQVLLRAGDQRYADLISAVAAMASPTGQWPEAVHPLTGGGCMGDGQHVWAAAEWILMLRNCFVREEKNKLILASGVKPSWFSFERPIRFGPTLTPFGEFVLRLSLLPEGVRVEWQGRWHAEPPEIEVLLPGYASRRPSAEETAVDLPRQKML